MAAHAARLRLHWTAVHTASAGPSPRTLTALALLEFSARRWDGALGNAAANFVGSYPWYLTFNWLNERLPGPQVCPLSFYEQALVCLSNK